jgi:uncharacterized membrane protein YphA (DoxX/SURF4 family)
MKIFLLTLRLLVAGVFLYAAMAKFGTSERFTITVAQFGMVPFAWVAPFALALPWLEGLAGILLLIPRTVRIGAVLAAALLILFIAALTWAWTQGLAVDCGCFGYEDEKTSTREQIPVALVRDFVLLAITLRLAARRSN